MSSAIANGNDTLESRLGPALSSALFPNRTSIYPWEFSRKQQMSVNQVIDLIRDGVILATRINSPSNKSDRCNYRIPVCEYDRFVLQGGTPFNGSNGKNGHAKNGHAKARAHAGGKATRR
jgi:hypothetical protein